MARDVVDGRADGLGKAAVAERRRVGVEPHAAVMRDGVDPIGGHARPNALGGRGENVAGHCTRADVNVRRATTRNAHRKRNFIRSSLIQRIDADTCNVNSRYNCKKNQQDVFF